MRNPFHDEHGIHMPVKNQQLINGLSVNIVNLPAVVAVENMDDAVFHQIRHGLRHSGNIKGTAFSKGFEGAKRNEPADFHSGSGGRVFIEDKDVFRAIVAVVVAKDVDSELEGSVVVIEVAVF